MLSNIFVSQMYYKNALAHTAVGIDFLSGGRARMEDEEKETAENYCVSCGSPIPPGAVVCTRCSQYKIAEKRPVEKPSEETSVSASVLRTPEESVRRGMSLGVLTKEQGELLLLVLSRGRLLDFSVRSVLVPLIKEIAEERNAKRREEREYTLKEFLCVVMPTDNLPDSVSRAFNLR